MKLKWQDLKIGDVIRDKCTETEYMIICYTSNPIAKCHVGTIEGWLDDEMLLYYEKVEC